MYDAVDDPYCYPGSTVLKNLKNLRTRRALDRFETAATAQRFSEGLPSGGLDVPHYLAVHRHIFQDVYAWAGHVRTVRISKDGSMFCYPEHIERELDRLFSGAAEQDHYSGLDPGRFAAGAAEFLAELNAIHAFRDGNGRSQMAFMTILADNAGHPLHLERIKPARFLQAMIKGFAGDTRPLADQLRRLI